MSTIVLASAGTGKTWTLVDAWVRAALGVHTAATSTSTAAPIQPDRLCAITFTEKAAAEMRARIEQRLAILRFSPAEEPALSAALMARHDDSADGHAWLDGVRRAVSRAPIGTIHAICARLLREHALAAGLDPQFSILEPDEEERLLTELAEGVVLDALAEGDAAASDLVARVPLRGLFAQQGLVECLVAVLQGLAERGIAPTNLSPAAPSEAVDTALARVHEAAAAIAAVVDAGGTKALKASVPPRLTKLRVCLERLVAIRADASEDVDGEVAAAFLEAQRALSGAWGGPSLTTPRRTLVEAVSALGAALVDEDATDLAPAVRELLITLDQRQRREKDLRGVLGFGDLLVRCRDLLRDHSDVRARVKARFERIFVDEYQDTSPVQEEILAWMAQDPEQASTPLTTSPLSAVTIPADRLFLVGDPKQSIYGFRGADAAVFARAREALTQQGGSVVPLDRSYRSTPAVCALANIVVGATLPGHVNELLTALPERRSTLPPGCGGSDVGRTGAWWQAAGAWAQQPLPSIEREAGLICERLLADVLSFGVTPSQVLVLTRRSRSTAVIGRSLSRRGVPVRVIGGDGFWRRPEVTDIVSALSLIIDPRDELAALTVLRSPLVGLPDDDILALFEALPTVRDGFSWSRIAQAADDALVPRGSARRIAVFDALIASLRSQLAVTPIATLIDRIVDESGYDVACAAERDAELRLRHLEKLRGIASRGGRHGSPEGVLGIARLVDAIDDPPPEPIALEAELGSDAVRIMTIHQSKGLEADIVVLADAGIAMRSSADDVAFDPDVGLAVSSRGRPLARCAPKASADVVTRIQRARKARRQRDELELARLLYVAMTRAREQFFVVGAPRRSGPGSMLGLLDAARTNDPDAFAALLPVVLTSDVGVIPSWQPPHTAGSSTSTPSSSSSSPPAITVLEQQTDSGEVEPRGPLRVRASTLLARATPQLAMALPGDVGGDGHDDDIVPPRARGRLAHAIIGLIATELPHVLDDDDALSAAIATAERAVGSPPGAIDDALRIKIRDTLRGPVLSLHREGRRFHSEVPAVLVVDPVHGRGVVVEGTADLVATGADDAIVVELKLSIAQARAESTTVQLLSCCAGLRQQGFALPLRFTSWALGERDPPPPQPWGKVAQRHLATVIAALGASS
jgi:ATP-dependent helicase/nuclease subunit A